MLTSYRTPGAYFEWQDSVAPRIDIPRTDIAGFAGIAMRGPLHRALKITSWAQFANVFGTHIPQGFLAYAVAGFFANGGRTCWVVRIADPARTHCATLELIDVAGPLALRATSPGTWANQARVRPVIRKGFIDSLDIVLTDGSEVVVSRSNFKPAYVAAAAETESQNFLSVPDEALAPDGRDQFEVQRLPGPGGVALQADGFLTGGWDGLEFLGPEFYADELQVFGLAALRDIDEISILAMPDLMPKLTLPRLVSEPKQNCAILEPIRTPPANVADPVYAPQLTGGEISDLQFAIVSQCHQKRYRFAILDTPPPVVTPDDAITYLNLFPGSDSTSSFAAMYFPWILVTDPLRLGGLTRAIPPSGHIAGVYARTDRARGVHKPPANEVVEEAFDTQFAVDEISHGDLNFAGVNAIRDSAGRGVRVLGARTLDASLRLRYVNVRRLLLMIEQALETQLQWTVHEPNNDNLWVNIERVVRSFLERLFHLGMLDGGTSEDAYSVRCDAKTNQDVTEEGKAICLIGLQPPYPAEFVIVRAGVTRNGIQIEERGSPDA